LPVAVDYIIKGLGIIVPFILLFITVRSAKRNKKDENLKKLNEENADLKRQLAENQQGCRDKKVDDLAAQVGELQEGLTEVKDKMDRISEGISEEVAKKVHESLEKVLCLGTLNLEYSQSLSRVIVKIGEGLRDNKINGNVSDAIAEHQLKEQELFKNVVKISC